MQTESFSDPTSPASMSIRTRALLFTVAVFAVTTALAAYAHAGHRRGAVLIGFLPALVALVVRRVDGSSPPLRFRPTWREGWRPVLFFVAMILAMQAASLIARPEMLRDASGISEQVAKAPLALPGGLAVRLALLFTINVLLGAVINAPLFLGEELGWRGELNPTLVRCFGPRGLLLGGAIWGLWHAPMIAWLDLNYPGTPLRGMLLMIALCIPLGVVLQWVYDRSQSLLVAALCHAFMNKLAQTLFMFVIDDKQVRWLVDGPAGLLATAICALTAYAVWTQWRRRWTRGPLALE